MAKKRIKISGAYNEFIHELTVYKNFDRANQRSFDRRALSSKQLHILTESVFFNSFILYENFVRDVFLLYTQGKKNRNRDAITSYLNPIDFFHAEKLIQSSMQVVDWNTPDIMINRAELYLKDGIPIKLPYIANRNRLQTAKTLRNHIAHNSIKSLQAYKSVLIAHYGALPIRIPSVGEYLLLTSRTNRNNYILMDFFELIEEMAINLS